MKSCSILCGEKEELLLTGSVRLGGKILSVKTYIGFRKYPDSFSFCTLYHVVYLNLKE